MPWIDGHLDLAYVHLSGRDIRAEAADPSTGCLSLPALRSAGVELVFATIFCETFEDKPFSPVSYKCRNADAARAAALPQLALYEQLADANEIRIIRSAVDLGRDGPIPGAVLLLEGADPIREPAELSWWAERGLRIVGLTWALGSRYAGGNSRPGPLTDLGRALISEINRLGLVHDISHLADEAVNELFSMATGPIVATHSNCRALMNDSQRHVTNEQICEIGRRGGIVGLNLFSKFLTTGGERATIDDCVRHIDHIAEIMGHRCGVALGSDMDGGFAPTALPIDLDHPKKLSNLAAALGKAGWPKEDVQAFAAGNWRDFLQRSLPTDSAPASRSSSD